MVLTRRHELTRAMVKTDQKSKILTRSVELMRVMVKTKQGKVTNEDNYAKR